MKWKMLKVDKETHSLAKSMAAERGMTLFGLVKKVLQKENNVYATGVFTSDKNGKINSDMLDGVEPNKLYSVKINELKSSDYEEVV